MALFEHVVTVSFRSGQTLRFRCDKFSIETSGADLTKYKFEGGDKRSAPRYMRLEEIEAITWRNTIFGLF